MTTNNYVWEKDLSLNDLVLNQKEEIERLKEELQIEKASNKELLSTGADLENKLYEEQDKNKRLNNIINKGIEAINVYQNEKTLSVGYQDLKRIRGILQGNEFDLQMFEEYLQELKGSDKE